MKYFTADTHFYHKNIIKYCNRPFSSVEEMNETMINNWNSVIGEGDLVYILGDFCFRNAKDILNRLLGQKILIIGSHDKEALKYKDKFIKTTPLLEIKEDGQKIVLCHYAMRTWARSHHNSWHLYGHSHGLLPSQGKSFDVGVDANNFMPLSLDDIKNKMQLLSDNPNCLAEFRKERL